MTVIGGNHTSNVEKQCNRCGDLKSVADFYKNPAGKGGLRPECKACTAAARRYWYEHNREDEIARVREWQVENKDRVLESQRKRRQQPDRKRKDRDGYLRRKYGITLEQCEELLAAQGGVCAICGRQPRDDISLHIDHDHESGRNRGLLCFRCNNALGDFGDDYDTLLAALSYLDEHDPEQQELVAIAKERLRGLAITGR